MLAYSLLNFGAEQTPELEEYEWDIRRVLLAKMTGWTPDTFDEMSMHEINVLQTVWAEHEKAKHKAAK